MSLKRKTIYGVIWTFADTVFVKGLSFTAMLLLARWLGPKDFGLMGMIAVFISIGTSLVDSGLSSSLIRTKNADKDDYTTVFYMNLGLSLLVYVILFLAAPYIATFYDQEILTDVIRIYCLSFIITAFSTIQLAILQKEMQFRKQMLLNIPSTIIGVGTGLFMGYNDFGVWSIVAMYLMIQVVLTILLWITSSWKPDFKFSKEKLVYHYKFGYKLMLSGLLDTVFKDSFNVLIGKYFPVQTLGHYERAKNFNEYPSMTITAIVRKVTYPMMAQLQDDTPKLAVIYKKLLKLAFFITAPIMLGAAAIAHPLFDLVLGSVWLPAVPYFQILSLAAMLYPIHAFNLNVLQVFGRSDLFLKLEIIKKAIVVLGLVIGFQFGVLGLVWSSVFTSFIGLLINTHYSSQLISYSTKNQLMDMLPILLLSGCTFLIMLFIVGSLDDYSNIIRLIGATTIGILFYLMVNSFFKNSPMYSLLEVVKNRKI